MPIAAITTLGKTVLLVVAITFIVWSLYTAMVVPKRRPGFPKRLDAYIALSALLFVAQMSAVLWVTGTQEVEEAEAAETLPAETTETETTPTETTETETTETETTVTETTETETTVTETTETETTETEPADSGAGKAVFASAGCGSCHALADADAAGAVGPDLDASMPSAELVVDRVTNGQGAMPAFADQLSETEIAAVADYVASVAGS